MYLRSGTVLHDVSYSPQAVDPPQATRATPTDARARPTTQPAQQGAFVGRCPERGECPAPAPLHTLKTVKLAPQSPNTYSLGLVAAHAGSRAKPRCSTQGRHSSARRGSDESSGDSAIHPTSKDCAPAQSNVAYSASEDRTSLAVVLRPTNAVGRVASPKLSCRGALLGQATGELFDGEPKTGATRDGEPKTPAANAESVAAAPAAVALTAAHGLLAGEGGTNSLLLRGALAGVARALAGD